MKAAAAMVAEVVGAVNAATEVSVVSAKSVATDLPAQSVRPGKPALANAATNAVSATVDRAGIAHRAQNATTRQPPWTRPPNQPQPAQNPHQPTPSALPAVSAMAAVSVVKAGVSAVSAAHVKTKQATTTRSKALMPALPTSLRAWPRTAVRCKANPRPCPPMALTPTQATRPTVTIGAIAVHAIATAVTAMSATTEHKAMASTLLQHPLSQHRQPRRLGLQWREVPCPRSAATHCPYKS